MKKTTKGEFGERDVFYDYDYEEQLLRYDHRLKKFFGKRYGESQEGELPHDGFLVNETIRFGDEVDEEAYRRGKPKAG